MSSSSSGHRYARGSLLLLIAMVTSLSTVVTCRDSRFTFVNCSAASSPAPSPTSSSFTDSTFWSNVVALLDALPSAASPTGFASLAQGNDTDRAFVRGLCRGDTTPANCATYLRDAALTIRRSSCNSSRRAGIWYDDGSGGTVPAPMFCFVSYADTNVSTGDEDVLREAMQNRAMLSAGIGAWAYYALMSSLGPRAINGTTSPPMFAAGTYVYDANASNGTLYGLMQCMRDRTAADCNRCLQDSMLQLASCCSGHQGGVVLGYNCYLRMEVYPFYDVALDAHAAPNSSNRERSPGKKGIVVILAIVIPVGVVLGVVTTILLVIRYKWRSKHKMPLSGNTTTEVYTRATTKPSSPPVFKQNRQ